MNALLIFCGLLCGLLALLFVAARLALVVARDGYGSNPPPRSHRDDLGSRPDQELAR